MEMFYKPSEAAKFLGVSAKFFAAYETVKFILDIQCWTLDIFFTILDMSNV